jgi:hypothetical protein
MGIVFLPEYHSLGNQAFQPEGLGLSPARVHTFANSNGVSLR